MADVAVVGSGLAGFTAYQTLRRGLEPGEIVVFGTDSSTDIGWNAHQEMTDMVAAGMTPAQVITAKR